MRIAIYGKGGIGKSTISANITAAMSARGLKVLQIGCDPKHDSTRLLLDGREPPTVMDYIRNTRKEDMSLFDVVAQGYGRSMCVEAGGPEPGVGCAGRGILSTFDLLDELGMERLEADVTIYDVLGDVVCGGFAVPLRNDYAEKVFIVTSGEFMAIYAANNILRGVRNYDPLRIGGIIFNSRGEEEERDRVHAFATAVGLPIVAEIPRSPLFLEGERRGKTVVETFPATELTDCFHRLAAMMLEGDVSEAEPLSDEDLERIVLGKEKAGKAEVMVNATKVANGRPRSAPVYTSRNVDRHEVLHGCAFTGAVVTCLSVQGLQTVMHSPDSCAHLSCQMAQNAARRAYLREGISIPSFLEPSSHCTSMDDPAMVFGAKGLLEEAIRKAASVSGRVAVVSSCPSGIIGDDVVETVRRMSAEFPDAKIVPMIEDGNAAGDHMQGVIDACVALADHLIDQDLAPVKGMVNVVGIKPIATNNERNMSFLASILGRMGMSVNCRFIGGTDVTSIEGFKKAEVSILANTDRFTRMLASFLIDEHGVKVMERPLTAGIVGTEAWVRELAALGGVEVERLLAELGTEYRTGLIPLRKELEGRSACIISMHKDIDWLIDLIDDLGIELRRAVVVDRSDHLMDYHVGNRHSQRIELLEDYVIDDVVNESLRLSPDILLSTYPVTDREGVVQERIPMVPDIGHLAPLEMARHWALALKAPRVEGWREEDD